MPETQSLSGQELDPTGSGSSIASVQDADVVKVEKIMQITYHYLTFETPLPQPISESKEAAQEPKPPNLRSLSNPWTWSNSRKAPILFLSAVGTMFTAYSAGSYAPAVDQMSAEFHVSRVAMLVGITLFTLGFAVAPMVLAPFSEVNGRRPVFVVAGVIFVATVGACTGTHDYAGMMVARFLGGCASSTFSTMVGGVVADLYDKSDRNTPMVIFTGSVIFGTGLGPLVSGFVAQNVSWRWVFGIHCIVIGIIALLVTFFFDETRASVLLSRRAKRLNEYYEERESLGLYCVQTPCGPESSAEKPATERIRWKVKSDEERATLGQMIQVSLYRPFKMLFTEPVVFFFSLWISFSWAVLYLLFSAIPYVFTTVYAFSLEKSNAVFAAVCVTALIGTALSIYQEKIALHYGKMGTTPEARLYFSAVQSVFLPIGLFMFGWTAYSSVPWIVPTIAIGFATLGIFSIYLATFNYLADSYGIYASSAIAAQSFCRNLLGGAFPLFTEQMFEALGIGGASSLLGGLAVLLTLVPWILAFFGPRIRGASKIAREFVQN